MDFVNLIIPPEPTMDLFMDYDFDLRLYFFTFYKCILLFSIVPFEFYLIVLYVSEFYSFRFFTLCHLNFCCFYSLDFTEFYSYLLVIFKLYAFVHLNFHPFFYSQIFTFTIACHLNFYRFLNTDYSSQFFTVKLYRFVHLNFHLFCYLDIEFVCTLNFTSCCYTL